MATITLDIPDGKVLKLIAAIKEAGAEQLDGENDRQFVKRVIREYFVELLLRYDARVATKNLGRDDSILS